MKILEKQIDFKSFTYNQVYRDGHYAIYSQGRGNTVYGYEAIRIRSHNGYEIAGVKILPSEIYPSSAKWGIDGYTVSDLTEAHKKILLMKNKEFTLGAVVNGEAPQLQKRGRGRPRKNFK